MVTYQMGVAFELPNGTTITTSRMSVCAVHLLSQVGKTHLLQITYSVDPADDARLDKGLTHASLK